VYGPHHRLPAPGAYDIRAYCVGREAIEGAGINDDLEYPTGLERWWFSSGRVKMARRRKADDMRSTVHQTGSLKLATACVVAVGLTVGCQKELPVVDADASVSSNSSVKRSPTDTVVARASTSTIEPRRDDWLRVVAPDGT
jgi:hypothetical protein